MKGALWRGAQGELERKDLVRSLKITRAVMRLATRCCNFSKPENGKNMFHFLKVI